MMRHIMRLLIIISIIVASGALSPGASAADKKAPPAKKPAASPGSKEKSAEKKVVDTATPQEKVPAKYTGMDAKRDPFQLPVTLAKALERPEQLKPGEKIESGEALPKAVIQGIIWNPQMPQIIVNNAVLRVGDFIEKFEIKEIKKNSMVLFFKGREYEIRMQNSPTPGIKPGRKP